MTNEELLEVLNRRFDAIEKRLDCMDSRLDGIDSRLDRLEETAEITRENVNTLIEWAEDCGNAIKFPLPRIAK